MSRLLERGPEAYGFWGAVWTEGQIAQVIRQVFGVSYHLAHFGRIMRACGWSLQKPVRRAGQRNQEATRLWGEELWPEVKKPEEGGRTVVFVDKSGFYLLPAVVRTFAPRGKTPVLRERWTNDHLSAISGVTPQGKRYMQVQEARFRSPKVVRSLRHLHRHLQGKLLVLWDGAPIHRSNVIMDFLAARATVWLQLERLPAYGPEMNPDEGVWHYLKRMELRNLTGQHLPQLHTELRKAKKRLRRKHHVLRACCTRPWLFTV